MSKAIKTVCLILILSLMLPVICVHADYGDALSLSLEAVGEASYGNQISIRIKTGRPATALIGLEFVLEYDSTKVEPIITANGESTREMDVFFVSCPSNWEQMSYHNSPESLYHFRFLGDGTDNLDAENELIIEVPFKVISAGSFDFNAPDTDVIAICADNDYTALGGKGDRITVAADSDTQKIGVALNGASTAYSGGIYYLDIEITNLGDANGIIALELELNYAKNVFDPLIDSNVNSEMDSFMVSMPNDSWEQLCSIDESKSTYTLRFAAINAESSVVPERLSTGKKIIVSVPFRVIASEGSIGSFNISSSSVIGLNSVNGIITGNGDFIASAVEKSLSITIPPELGLSVKNGYLIYVDEKTELEDFIVYFEGLHIQENGKRVVDGYIKTGQTLTDGNTFSLKLVVYGDGNGDGVISYLDYLTAKRIYLGTLSSDNAVKHAISFKNGESPTILDCLMLKRHVLGTYNIKK